MPSWCLWRRLSLEEVHLHSCLFVSICGSSSLTISRFSSNDPPTRAGLALLESPVVFTILSNRCEPSRPHGDEQRTTNRHELLSNFKRPQLEWERLFL